MKILLIILNLLLAGGSAWQAFSLLAGGSDEITITTKDRSRRNTVKTDQTDSPETGRDISHVLSGIAMQNIFDTARCPEVLTGGGSSALVLIGVYRMGPLQGAIFQQRTIQQRRNWMGGPNRNTQQVKQLPPKRFLKLGETLENGYTLTAVFDDHIVLSRSGSTMELYIQRASTNLPSSIAARNAAARRSRPNPAQMVTGLMARQVQLMEQMARGMQRSQRTNQGNVNRSTRSR